MRQALHIAALAVVVILGLSSGAAAAESAVVRSGEHYGFSRLVVTLARPVNDWSFGRLADGYQLRVGRAVRFDLSEVFTRIPRSRLADISADGARGRLSMQLACACHAEIFSFRPNILVIDIRPGVAKPKSPFEKPLEEARAVPKVLPPPVRRPAATYDWREVAQPALPPPYTPDLQMPRAPDPSVLKAREALLKQLARAGAQGLVQADPEQLRLARQPDAGPTDNAADAGAKGPSSTDPTPSHAATGVTESTGTLGMSARTVMDRDAPQSPDPGLAATGRHCPPDTDFALAAWGKDTPPGPQIGAARRAVVGEFDRPDPSAIKILAKTYIRFGFGAEARQVLRAFDVKLKEGRILAALGAIIDGDHPGLTRPLSGLAACDGAVAMWSMLADPSPAEGDPVNSPAVIRAFSALPLGLRRMIGPRLSNAFLARHDSDTARALRDAILRAPGNPGDAVRLLGARLDIARGKLDTAETTIGKVVADAGPATPDAMVMLIDTKVAQGASVDGGTVEAVAALAHEYRGTARGQKLARAHVLALGLASQYRLAFAQLADRGNAPASMNGAPELWAMLAERGPDEAVVQSALVPPAGTISPTTRLKMADRLIAVGFDDAADTWLASGQTPDAARRLRQARAALGQRDGRAALQALAGATDPVAARLRARAYALLGDHAKAGAIYAEVGATAQQGAEAWRAGDWQNAAQYGTKAQKAALVLAQPGSADQQGSDSQTAPRPAAQTGPLARGKTLVDDSSKIRTALTALLAESALAAAPVSGAAAISAKP